MRAAILVTLAAAIVAATAADSQPARHPAPIPAPRPQKCPYHYRLAPAGPCNSSKPWRCERCPDGVRITHRLDRCGAPIETCEVHT